MALALLLIVAVGIASLPRPAAGDTGSSAQTGQAPDRFTAAQLADPAYYPHRGFWDIKGVTRFGGTPDDAAALASMGVGRLDTSWVDFEPNKLTAPCPSGYDTYEGHCFKPPTATDAEIKRYTDAGMPVIAIVYGTPAWARGTLPCVPYNAWSDAFCIPDHPEDFARFAGYLAHHYDGASGNGRITDFVIQNEVNLNQWFNTGCGAGISCDLATWVQDYADIYNDSYDEIRGAQANAKVMIPLTQHFEKSFDDPDATHPAYSIKTFLPLVVAKLGNRAWSLALHPYPRSVTPAIDARDLPYATMGNLGVVVGWLRATYPDTPSAWNVDLTEQGLNNPGLFDTEQADSLCKAFEGVLGTPGITSFVYHSLHDNIGEFGLYLGLLQADGTPKPAYATWLHANDPDHPTCGFENAGTTVIRTGVDPNSGAIWTSSRPLPSGYAMQTRQWRLSYDSQPGTVMAFECGNGDDDATPATYPSSTWLSLAADCDGATPMGPVGWIHTATGPGLTPIVTCTSGTARTTTDGTCSPGASSTTIGYATAEDVPDDVLAEANAPTTTTSTVPVDVQNPDLSGYDVVFRLSSGSFKIGAAGEVALPDGDPASEGNTYLAGTWNRTTGALDVDLLIPQFTALVQTSILPDPIPTSFQMTQIGVGFGSLDPATGALRVDLSVNTQLGSPEAVYAGFIGPSCILGPTSLTLTTSAPFDLDSPEPTATIGDAGFLFPATHGCGNNGDMDQVLNPALQLPSTSTKATMTFAMIKGAPADTADTTTTTSATTSTSVPPTSTSSTSPSTSMSTTSTTVASTSTSQPTSTTAAPTTQEPTSAPTTSTGRPGSTSTSTSTVTGTSGAATSSSPPTTRRIIDTGEAQPAPAVAAVPTYTG